MPEDPSNPPRRRKLSALQFHLMAGALVLALGLAVGLLRANTAPGDDVPFAGWIIAAALIVGGTIAIAGWRRLDEAAKEAHKWAWYWGASAGMLAAFAVVLMGEQGTALVSRVGLGDSLEDGVTFVLALEVVGYALAWAFWWLKRR